MHPILYLIHNIINIYSFMVFVYIIINMLVSFQAIRLTHPIMQSIYDSLGKCVEPLLRRIRRYVPSVGTLDLSPLVLIIGLNLLDYTLVYYGG